MARELIRLKCPPGTSLTEKRRIRKALRGLGILAGTFAISREDNVGPSEIIFPWKLFIAPEDSPPFTLEVSNVE
jgi:hypothetical protein